MGTPSPKSTIRACAGDTLVERFRRNLPKREIQNPDCQISDKHVVRFKPTGIKREDDTLPIFFNHITKITRLRLS